MKQKPDSVAPLIPFGCNSFKKNTYISEGTATEEQSQRNTAPQLKKKLKYGNPDMKQDRLRYAENKPLAYDPVCCGGNNLAF